MAQGNLPDLSKIWPEWEVVKKVGEGSYGKVYRCERDEYGINSVCAIKIISIPQNSSELESVKFEGFSEAAAKSYFGELVKDFANEIKMMLVLKGASNIVSVENYKIVEKTDTIGWDIYIRMEFLTSFIKFSAGLEFNEPAVKRFGLDLCNALDICSKKDIIHRDIKPDNIFVDDYGNYKIGDFGVAKRLEGTVGLMSKKGTYAYMAPEVFRGDHYDNRADIYSLGMVMYKLLNRNRDPFIDQSKQYISINERNESFDRRRGGEKLPPPVDASPEMAEVILKACAFNPDDRYKTAKEFKKALLALDIDVDEDDLFNQYKEKQMLEEIKPDPIENPEDDEKTEVLEGTEAVMFEVANALKDHSGRSYEENDDDSEPTAVYAGDDIPVGKGKPKRIGKKVIILIAALLVLAAGVAAALIYGNGRWYNVVTTQPIAETTSEVKETPEEAEKYLDKVETAFIYETRTPVEVFEMAKPYLEFYDEKVAEFALEICTSAQDRAYSNAKKLYDAKNYSEALKITSGILRIGGDSEKIKNLHALAMNSSVAGVRKKIDKTKEYAAIDKELNAISEYCVTEQEKAQIEQLKAINSLNKEERKQKVYAYDAYITQSGNAQYADFSVKNMDSSGRTVTRFKFSIFEFDGADNPVSVTTHKGNCVNEKTDYKSYDIGSYETYQTANDDAFGIKLENKTANIKVFVSYVEFSDGTTWSNPYYDLWVKVNYPPQNNQ